MVIVVHLLSVTQYVYRQETFWHVIYITNGQPLDLKLSFNFFCRYFQREFTMVNLLLKPSFVKIQLHMKQPSENKYSYSICNSLYALSVCSFVVNWLEFF